MAKVLREFQATDVLETAGSMHPARVYLGPFRACWLHPLPRPVAADGATPSATPIAASVECVLQAKPYGPARVGPCPVAAPYGLPA